MVAALGETTGQLGKDKRVMYLKSIFVVAQADTYVQCRNGSPARHAAQNAR